MPKQKEQEWNYWMSFKEYHKREQTVWWRFLEWLEKINKRRKQKGGKSERSIRKN